MIPMEMVGAPILHQQISLAIKLCEQGQAEH